MACWPDACCFRVSCVDLSPNTSRNPDAPYSKSRAARRSSAKSSVATRQNGSRLFFQNPNRAVFLLRVSLAWHAPKLTFAGRRSASREKASGSALGLRATPRRIDLISQPLRIHIVPQSDKPSGDRNATSRVCSKRRKSLAAPP